MDEPRCCEILGKLLRVGLSVALCDITTDIGIAAFACFIVPRDDTTMWHCSVAAGYGCHPTRHIALIRAVTEAAQSRLTVISGLRDDFRHEAYDEMLDPDLVRIIRDPVYEIHPLHDALVTFLTRTVKLLRLMSSGNWNASRTLASAEWSWSILQNQSSRCRLSA